MKKREEEHYWNRFAGSYDRDGECVVGKRIIQLIEKALLSERSLGHVLDCGCGTGIFTKAIASNAQHVVAADLSNEMLEAARIQLRDFKNVTIQKADCSKTSFPPKSFDSVFLINLIHVIENPLSCLRESHRILRNKGTLIVVDFTSYRLGFAKKMKSGFRYLKTWGLPPRGGRNNMSPEELGSLIEHAGFQVEHVQLLVADVNTLYLKGTKKLEPIT
jgi:ubiquinone/menaquinone biosynthesis C-methylase UbiE